MQIQNQLQNQLQNYNQQQPQTYTNPYAPPSRTARATEVAQTTFSSLLNVFGKSAATTTAAQTAGTASTTVTTTGTSAAGAAATGTSAAGAVAGSVNVLGGIVGAYNLFKGWGESTPAQGAASGAAVGATLGTYVFPGLGTAAGAAIGAVAGGLIGAIHAGKHADQKLRDAMRDQLQGAGILNDEFQFQLADGSMFDMGKDGGAKLEGGNRYYEVDSANPLAAQTVSWLNPIMELVTGGHPKLRSDFVGYFTNAILSRATSLDEVRAQVSHVMNKFGLTNEQLAQGSIELARAGRIDEQTARAYINGIQDRMTPAGR